MFVVVDGLARLLAPILSVTMDELWRGLPGRREASVHMALFPQRPRRLRRSGPGRAVGRCCGAVRDAVNVALEAEAPGQDHRGNLSAAVAMARVGDALARCSSATRTFLPTLFGVSAVHAAPAAPATAAPWRGHARRGRQVRALLARRARGERAEPGRAGLCPRCVEALAEPVSL